MPVCKASSKGRKSKRVTASGVNESSEESAEECEIGKIYDNSQNGGCVLAELDLKFNNSWETVLCELDTGANTSLIGLGCLKKLTGTDNPELLVSKFRLQSFGGNPITVLGQVKVPCRRPNRKFSLVLQVVDVDHRPLLSARASRKLVLVKFYNAVTFEEPVQHLPRESSRNRQQLEIDDSVTPTIQPPRRVPIAIRAKLKEELEKLESDGIIVKETKHTEWVSNVVIVQRGSGFRICLDPVPLNKALKRPNHQFVTLDEVLPELGKARVFSTVDAKKGFWHVVLDEPSSKLTTFWTPFGRYRWIRLPFGVAPAPEIFQIKLQEVIQGLKALADHNRRLEKLLCRLELHNVKLNKPKLKLCERSVKFYGHVLTDEGLKPDTSHW
ncbi:uncharacterized protein K02A2.6-like [Culex pipiens pallens]|uniref:uncharacterized protein K02A2.6-like n=1 Tax=Culex pipiens pallens TaxID=42434 RepID=UPI0022AAF061|nr:uncharacterized protein K02A2.6-like [Culex pipiens pallens]